MTDLIVGEEPLAICYLKEEGDHAYKLELTNLRLLITLNRRVTVIFLDTLQSIGFSHRKQILLMIYGGVAAPLGTVALFGNLLHPFILLLLIITGFFAFYIGLTGSLVLTTHLVSGHQDFPIHDESPNLLEFINFTNKLLASPREKGLLYYFLVPAGEDMNTVKTNMVSGGIFRMYTIAYLRNELVSDKIQPIQNLITIDIIKSGAEIRYKKSTDEQVIWPYLIGKVNPSSLSEAGTVADLLQKEDLKLS